MTNEMKLRFAYAEIALLKKDIVAANREEIDFLLTIRSYRLMQ